MQYISGIQALNMPCNLLTTGDWHQSGIQWKELNIKETENSIWGEYGIEGPKKIPNHKGKFFVANHLRAILDMLAEHDFSNLSGMKNDYICADIYDKELFTKVYMLHSFIGWKQVDRFMEKEYMYKWIYWREQKCRIGKLYTGKSSKNICKN